MVLQMISPLRKDSLLIHRSIQTSMMALTRFSGAGLLDFSGLQDVETHALVTTRLFAPLC
jgi:hypothetical protein